VPRIRAETPPARAGWGGGCVALMSPGPGLDARPSSFTLLHTATRRPRQLARPAAGAQGKRGTP
jgi:hypothetical protein